ncbi:alpha-2-macroglobulin receptor-associated protein-like protein [Dinothrombium tinctorium]|uniref:Alpha-2-macroglobulin receptor-associated protein-like protein n=1 Tax=Dinothrombium tinctorium TaxID=1965070 RepID=A0A3S3P089_9ACAR|nr:alpha-2-macroglobulin receptor-associated protein-like protein [Dinothrombium tinctorium]
MRLSGQKLKNLKSDLKIQDKEELALKKLKAEKQDKNGAKEAQLKKNLKAIVAKYGIEDILESDSNIANVDETQDILVEKQLFKDKKLDKLWRKVQSSKFDDEQLKVLKEEFKRQQEKIDEYHKLFDVVEHKEQRSKAADEQMENSIEIDLKVKDEKRKKKKKKQSVDQQALDEKRKEVKEGYRTLEGIVSSGLTNFTHFEEEKVQELWKLAQKSDFTEEELQHLKEELKSHENRIKKLRYLEEQLKNERLAGKHLYDSDEIVDHGKHLKKRVEEINYKVEKTHRYIESKIMQRHIEL